jgi:hypothetical protein
MFPHKPMPNVGILKAISPIWAAEEAIFVDENGTYKPRRSAEWMALECRLVLISEILYSRHAFHFDPRLEHWSTAGVPTWWNMSVDD